MNVTIRAQLSTIRTSLTALEVTLPKAVGEAVARHDAIVNGYESRKSTGATDELTTALAAAIEAGRDPAADPAVQTAITAQALTAHDGVRGSLAAHAEGILAATLAAEAPATLAALGTPFDIAAAKLTAAVKVLGDVDLDDTNAVLRLGGGAAEAWASATTAVATVDTVSAAWAAVAAVSGVQVNPGHKLLIVADIDAATFTDDKPADVWAAVRNGHPLRLATLDTFRSAVADLAALGRDRDADAQAAAMGNRRRVAMR